MAITLKREISKDIRKLVTTGIRAVFIRVSKNDWFSITALYDWLKNLAPLCHPIRSKTKDNHDSFARFFPRFAPHVFTSSFDWFTAGV